MYDPRIIANQILDEAAARGIPVTNLALQKLLYFCHAQYLIETKRPLVSGHFEAWQFGPVHPVVYRAFKIAADQPITYRAPKIDALSGRPTTLEVVFDERVIAHISRLMESYGTLTPGRLVEISHAKGAPWDFVVEKARQGVALGMRITDSVILERFRFHKVRVAVEPQQGEPGEDAPIVA